MRRVNTVLGAKMSQPGNLQQLQGMTVNELLFHLRLTEEFDRAAAARDRAGMVAVLERSHLTSEQAEQTARAILADPARYGY